MIRLVGYYGSHFAAWCRENGIPTLAVVARSIDDQLTISMLSSKIFSKDRRANELRYFFIRSSDYPLVVLRYANAVSEIDWLYVKEKLQEYYGCGLGIRTNPVRIFGSWAPLCLRDITVKEMAGHSGDRLEFLCPIGFHFLGVVE